MIPRGSGISGFVYSRWSSSCKSSPLKASSSTPSSPSSSSSSSPPPPPPPPSNSHNTTTTTTTTSTKSLVLLRLLIVILLHLPEEAMGTEYVVGVAGSRAELPCHLLAEQQQDRAILALWYIQGRRLPVYSYDARGMHGLHQPDDVLSGRGSFDTSQSPARLMLNPVLAKDQGVYTCRVDFISSPTQNTVVNLTVIEPPEKLAIYDSGGTLVRDIVGPINEGSPLSLSCLVIGGRPQPTASWWSGRTLVERRTEVTREGHIKSELKIPEVTRAYHEKSFVCKAQNNNQQKPLSQEVTLQMNLRPLSVNITIPDDPLIAGRQYTFTCESKGSKPPAAITWFQETHQVDAMRTHTRPSSGGLTIGEVTVVPHQRDHGKSLKCKASNPSLQGSTISDSVILNVHYAPVVALEMGRNLVPGAIKQGDDVYFECKVKANPQPYRVTWEKNNDEVKHNQTAGVILSGNSLVLQQVDRSSAGEYTCSATNTQGTEVSNAVRLDIMYPPECMVDQPTVLAVGRGERVNITCRVASNPPRATFNWRLNGSDKTYTSPGERLPWGHLASHYTFLGATDKDYGALFCWANNSIGIQEKPCVFQIIPAGPPSSPEHCEIINNTAENIEVMCEHGFDGGMAQLFLAEVYDELGSLHLNHTSEEPQFSVESLQPGTTYTIRISAFNAKGRSQPISLTAVTLKVAEQRVGENNSLFYSPLIIIFLSIVGVFVALILILVSVTRWRKNNMAHTVAHNTSTSTSSSSAPTAGGGASSTNPTNIPLDSVRPGDALENLPPKEEMGEAVKVKPKKKVVVVVENGTKDRLGAGDTSSKDISSSKDALLGRQAESLHLANGSAGYYNSLGKTSFPSSYQSSSSSSTLPRSHKTVPSSGSLLHHSPPPYTSDAGGSREGESQGYYFKPRYSETLPRNLGRTGGESYRGGGILRVGGSGGGGQYGNDSYGGSSLRVAFEDTVYSKDSGAPSRDHYQEMPGSSSRGVLGGSALDLTYHERSPSYHGGLGGGLDVGGHGARGVNEKYHLLEELKNNPKYVVRTRACDPSDESFV